MSKHDSSRGTPYDNGDLSRDIYSNSRFFQRSSAIALQIGKKRGSAKKNCHPASCWWYWPF